MSRKVFISFLGTTNYGACNYEHNGISYGTSRFAQEVTLNYLMQKETWSNTDIAYILMTEESERKNWKDFFYNDRETQTPLTGLETCLKQMNLPFPIHAVRNLPIGNNEEEIWQIFQRVFNECMQEGDELYFDITHGFRYLPMLTIVLGNYAKFLRNITVKSITYGNYEISNYGKDPGLIVDLISLSNLQDWTYASGHFIQSGDATRLTKLAKDELTPLMKKHAGSDSNTNNLYIFITRLNNFTKELRTCRGTEIIEAKNISQLSSACANINASIIPQLEPLISKIQTSLQPFNTDPDTMNGIAAAQWCLSHGLYQQTATLLQETIITHLCHLINIDWKNLSEREIVSAAFYNKIHPDDPLSEKVRDHEQIILKLQTIPQFINLITVYLPLSELRNDFNHAGMRISHSKPDDIINKLDSLISLTQVALNPLPHAD